MSKIIGYIIQSILFLFAVCLFPFIICGIKGAFIILGVFLFFCLLISVILFSTDLIHGCTYREAFDNCMVDWHDFFIEMFEGE